MDAPGTCSSWRLASISFSIASSEAARSPGEADWAQRPTEQKSREPQHISVANVREIRLNNTKRVLHNQLNQTHGLAHDRAGRPVIVTGQDGHGIDSAAQQNVSRF